MLLKILFIWEKKINLVFPRNELNPNFLGLGWVLFVFSESENEKAIFRFFLHVIHF